ncbi:hypothetical protein OSH08_05540 [Kaistia geumhonensis]|uniref:DUF2190 family protein n=1 Tax=Kaistia geumhonensis TaxID=410839 RepID=A0ABU0M5T0_9HYPH|nr:hypothetical protein [Kaistia geumhonensis]MCX5478456.1 hypothetical protein [Kaistia geumhonensis]MDQ0516326.1 hypothetical protein [Kaistia geumhonensis]
MADLSITAANVIAGDDSVQASGIAGEAVAAGKVGYYNTSTRRYMLADSNSATVEARRGTCIFLNGAAAGQPVKVHRAGDITIGATLTAATAYYLSDTPGGICPLADVGSGEYVCQVGLARSTTVLTVDFQFPGVAL